MTAIDDAWRGTPLPRGRHKLPREDVRASQRERLLRSMLERVGEQGYGATTVPEVVAGARVSKNAFYEFFDDKLDCFLALCDEEARGLFHAVVAAGSEPTWRQAVAAGMESYLRWWQDRPAFSRAYLVELPFAGPRAVDQRSRASKPYRRMYAGLAERARAEEPELPPVSPKAPDMLVVGVTEVVAQEVRAGRVDRLARLGAPLTSASVAMLAGA